MDDGYEYCGRHRDDNRPFDNDEAPESAADPPGQKSAGLSVSVHVSISLGLSNTADQLRGPRRPLAIADLVSCIRLFAVAVRRCKRPLGLSPCRLTSHPIQE